MERFVTILNHPKYEVSNTGKVRNKKTGRCVGKKTKEGYLMVRFRDEKRKIYDIFIHRLVLINFIGIDKNRPVVNHKDGIKTNNNISNLEWCTKGENNIHAVKTGLKISVKGEQHFKAQLKESEVVKIKEMLRLGIYHKSIAKRFGVNVGVISSINRGASWKHVR